MAGLFLGGCHGDEQQGAGGELRGTISISGAWALCPMMVRWSEEYHALHPKIEFDISAGGAGKGITDALAGAVEIGMVSREIRQEELDQGAFGLMVVEDAIVLCTDGTSRSGPAAACGSRLAAQLQARVTVLTAPHCPDQPLLPALSADNLCASLSAAGLESRVVVRTETPRQAIVAQAGQESHDLAFLGLLQLGSRLRQWLRGPVHPPRAAGRGSARSRRAC